MEIAYTATYRGFESHPLRHTQPALVSIRHPAREGRGWRRVAAPKLNQMSKQGTIFASLGPHREPLFPPVQGSVEFG